MTRESLKRQLNLYCDLEAERRQIEQELKKIEELMTAPRGTNMDGMPRSSGTGDPVLGVVSQHITLMERYQRQLKKMTEAQNGIEDMIESLEPIERRILRHRYIDGMHWEEVCVAVGYSWRQTHNIHSKALDKLLESVVDK